MKLGSISRLWNFTALMLIFALLFVCALSSPAVTRLYDTNIVVLRIGNGVQILNTGGNQFFFDQFTPSGVYVSSVAVPDSGASPLVLSGNSTNDCFLTRSADGRFLSVACFATNSGTGQNIARTGGPPRAVLNVDALGNLTQPPVTTTDFTQLWRSAVTDGTNNYWGVGNTAGVVYLGTASPKATVETTKPNNRVIEIFNGSLYVSSLWPGSDGYTGIYKLNGLPKSNTPWPAPIVFTNTYDNVNEGVEDFAVNSFNTIIYFADSRVPYDSLAGGIQRWDYDNVHGAWVNTYHLTNGLPGDGLQNLTVDWSGPAPVLYATTIGYPVTNRNSLVKVTDTGANSPFTILTTSGASQVYRGVRFGPSLAAPIIVNQPQDQYTTVGGAATFSVDVTGASTLVYQWQFNNAPLAGATNSSLTISSAQLTNAGTYQVVVTNNAGSATSQPATLTIETSAPIITGLTSNVLAQTATTATLSVIVDSSGPATYQWLYGTTPISGATDSTLTITKAQFVNAGTYYVDIGNQAGATLSPPVKLTMFTAPSDTNVIVGNNITLAIQVAGPASPTFQWRFDGEDIRQATETSLSIINAQTTNAGFYSIVCSVPGMTAVSSGGFLSVIANPTSNPPGSTPAPRNLVNWWPFDGNLNDAFGNNNASPVAGVSIVNGEVGLGCYFDAATNTHLNVDGTPIPPPWTASCWVYHQNTPWVSSAIIGDKLTSLKLEQNRNTSKVGFTKFGSADYSFNYIAPIDTWVHLVWVSTSTNTSLYVNGVLQDTLAHTINLPRGQIGADFGGTIDHVLGVIDELMLFNRALNASEILAIYNAGSSGVIHAPEFVNSSSADGNQFTSSIQGLTGKTLSVYGSSNLVDWLLVTNAPNTTGLLQFTDPFPAPTGSKFFKATQH